MFGVPSLHIFEMYKIKLTVHEVDSCSMYIKHEDHAGVGEKLSLAELSKPTNLA